MAFSPDSQLLATVSDREVGLWDPATGASRYVLEGQSGRVKAMAFSPDSQLLATAWDREVRLWVSATGASRGVLKGQSGQVEAMAFSPDGQLLATASYGEVRLWDPAKAAFLDVVEGQSGQAKAIAFCPDGQLLVIAHNVRSPKQGIQAQKPSRAQSKVCIFRHILARKTIFWCCVEGSIESLSLSPDWRYLLTNHGAADISLANTPQRPSPLHLYAKEQWVIWKNEGVLWLPPEYRTACPSVHENMLALADSSGQVFFLNFGSKLSSESDDDGDVSSVDGPDYG
jgi:WD40 repeat protein